MYFFCIHSRIFVRRADNIGKHQASMLQQQFVKLTACIRSDASSKRTCLLCVLMTD